MNAETSRQRAAEGRGGVRVNLTLPPEVDAVLARVADAAGTGKASVVRDWLVGMVPQLNEFAAALEAAREGQADALSMMSKTLRQAGRQAEQAELELSKIRATARLRKRPR